MSKAAAAGQSRFQIPAQKTISRNIVLFGHRTSIRLEEPMWDALVEAARRERLRIGELCELVLKNKQEDFSFTSAVRVFLVNYFRRAATEDGHFKAGHGVYTSVDEEVVTTSLSRRMIMRKPN